MKKQVIAIDVDEVLFPFVREFVRYYNELKGTTLTSDDFWTYNFDEVLRLSIPETMEHVFAHYMIDVIEVEPLKEAQSAIRELSQRYELVIVTARFEKYGAAIKAWLGHHFSGDFSHVIMTGHTRSSKVARNKVDVCQEIKAIALIDDSLEHVSGCAGVGIKGILFGSYPWNQGELPSGVTRCLDWAEILEHMKELA